MQEVPGSMPAGTSARTEESGYGSDLSEAASKPVCECGLRLPTPPPGPEQLILLPVLSLHPTQLQVGMQQVGEKEQRIIDKQLSTKPKKLDKFLRNHPIPVVLGPARPASSASHAKHQPMVSTVKQGTSTTVSSATTAQTGLGAPGTQQGDDATGLNTTPPASGTPYLIDHHHLALALYRQQIQCAYCSVVLDWRRMTWDQFWQAMQEKKYVWQHNPQGQPLELEDFVSQLPSDVRGLTDDPYRSLAALVRRSGGYDKVWVPFSEFTWANWLRPRVLLAAGEAPDAPRVLQAAMRQAASPEAATLPGAKTAVMRNA